MINDPFNSKRITFDHIDSLNRPFKASFSMAIDTNAEEILAAKQSVIDNHEKFIDFESRPEHEKLKYYLALTSKTLLDIIKQSKIDISKIDDEEYRNAMKYRLTNIMCVADLAIIQIPNQYRTCDIQI